MAEIKSWHRSLMRMLTPLPADTSMPYWLMRKVTTSQLMPAMVICRALGMPSRKIIRIMAPRIRRKVGVNSIRPLRRASAPRASKKLSSWEMVVARAAPDTPICMGPTSHTSSPRFTRVESKMMLRGVRESPTPRSTAARAL